MKPHFDQLVQCLEQITQQLTALEGVFSRIGKESYRNKMADKDNEAGTDRENLTDVDINSNATINLSESLTFSFLESLSQN
jgi:hypothetical protein